MIKYSQVLNTISGVTESVSIWFLLVLKGGVIVMKRIGCIKSIICLLALMFLAVCRGPTAFAASGTWKYNSKGTWFSYSDGSYAKNDWLKISGNWYHFDKTGYVQTGWQKLSGKWYWLGNDGAMKTGWQKLSGKWYHFDKNGAMHTGWMKSGKNWFFFKENGAMVTGTRKIGGKTYLFNSAGVLQKETGTTATDDDNLKRYLTLVRSAFQKEGGLSYSTEIANNDIVIKFWENGYSPTIEKIKLYYVQYGYLWENFKGAFQNLANTLYDGLDKYGIRNKNCKVYFVSDIDQNEIYLEFINGLLTYDALAIP